MILPNLQSPQELAKFSVEDLKQLAQEIREEIFRLYHQRSVHFASNLGVVELCIALHSTFDFSHDRLIWDTGHQIYPHKLLTGRYSNFASIRTKGGLMGFPSPSESPYDLMMTGHAGCSVGTALGLACGDELLAGPDVRHSVAVIGDGAFSNGTVFEAMNHAGELKRNITIILNDNKMAICPRVGGFSAYLDRLRLHPTYNRFKQKLHDWVDRTPFFGRHVDALFARFKDAIKAGLHGGMLFEELGFRYIGPIDGHDIPRLQRLLKLTRSYAQPVLLHIFTEKGRGFKPAEQNPTLFHAPAPGCGLHKVAEAERSAFHLTPPPADNLKANHSPVVQEKSFTECARDAVFKLMEENDRVCVITAAMCQGNMLEPIREKCPERYFDVGICESHAVIFAAGLAKSGMIPIVDIYSTFLQRSYDQIFQEVSLQNLPVILAIDRAGLVGSDGPTHHGVFDLAFLRPFPKLEILAPADANDVVAMFRYAVESGKPVAIRYPKANTRFAFAQSKRPISALETGKAEILRPGKDGSIVVCGPFLNMALEAATILDANESAKEQIDCGVMNARFVKPLDTKTLLQPLRDGKFLVTVEEGMLAGGFGSALLEAASDEGLDTRELRRLGIPDRFVEHGERGELLHELGLDVANLVEQCRELAFHG